ncbi:MAG: amino acid permease [Clostridiales Family XIII bacterium]|jgi:APA family basic amino acid/polyamine antiporter|nr:amino acid permease [Clostridiales Family XIII bacterium]
MSSSVLRKLPLETILGEKKEGEGLKKTMGWVSLMFFGLGAIIGSGIFVVTGVAAGTVAGPALIVSFIIAGVACLFAALCYAELASAIPASGSVYTFAYVGLGEVWGWFIAWCLLAEYIFACSAISTGWSAYFNMILGNVGINLPAAITAAPDAGGLVNLPAILIITILMLLALKGTKESAVVNNILVVVKVSVLLLFVVLTISHINTANYEPFAPFGWFPTDWFAANKTGVVAGAAIVFFSYLGFDAIANLSEEAKDPGKDVPKGILGALIVSTVLYIVIVLCLTGVVNYTEFASGDGNAAPVAYVLRSIGIVWGSTLVSVGGVCGLTTGILVTLVAGSRLIYSLGREGLLPAPIAKINKNGVPTGGVLFVWVAGCLLGGFLPIGKLAELCNIGTIFAFSFAAIIVMVLRKSMPNLDRKFKVPLVPVVPILAIAILLFMATQLQSLTWIFFVVWNAVGFGIYFLYGRNHSKLADTQKSA